MTAFLESWGTGVSRMVDACKTVGLPEPEYGTDGGFVWITFKRPNSVTNPVTNSDTDPNTKPSVNHDLPIPLLVGAENRDNVLEK